MVSNMVTSGMGVLLGLISTRFYPSVLLIMTLTTTPALVIRTPALTERLEEAIPIVPLQPS